MIKKNSTLSLKRLIVINKEELLKDKREMEQIEKRIEDRHASFK